VVGASPEHELPSGPTGRQFILGDVERGPSARIAQVGAALRALRVGGVELVPPYPDDAPTPAASGVVLVPWPNRIRDGVWTQDGQTRRLAITEPALNNASHGLLRFAAYQPVEVEGGRITLEADVYPQTGYPFHLSTRVTYELTASGIEVTHRLVNVGAVPAPVALGTHPYLMIGGVPTRDLVLTSSGTNRLVVDEQLVPVDEVPVGPSSDLRSGRRLGDVTLDTAYTGLTRDADDRVRHSLTAPDGRSLVLWQGPGFDYAQIFTTDRYPGQSLAVAIEPMTAPANAFNSGRGLRWLGAGESWSLSWGIALTEG
jgi:aldose 1-epimerase